MILRVTATIVVNFSSLGVWTALAPAFSFPALWLEWGAMIASHVCTEYLLYEDEEISKLFVSMDRVVSYRIWCSQTDRPPRATATQLFLRFLPLSGMGCALLYSQGSRYVLRVWQTWIRRKSCHEHMWTALRASNVPLSITCVNPRRARVAKRKVAVDRSTSPQ